jgi:hypothetical protein
LGKVETQIVEAFLLVKVGAGEKPNSARAAKDGIARTEGWPASSGSFGSTI